jgi:hypothetical protein
MKNVYMGVVVPLAILLPVMMAAWKLKQLNAVARIILAYLLTSAVVSLAASAMIWNRMNNLPVSHLYTVVEFFFFTFFYRSLLQGKKTITVIQVCFLLACILNTLFVQDLYQFNSYTRSLEALVIMLLSVNYYALLFTDIATVKPLQHPAFWFNTGIFLYFSGAFMLFVFSNYMLKESVSSFKVVWNVHATFVLIMYLLFTLGFLKCKK